MEVRDLTARFAACAVEAQDLDPAAALARWRESVVAAHPDVYEHYFRRRGGDGGIDGALPALLREADRLVLRAERAVGALEALQETVADKLGVAPPRTFCVILVGDGAERSWIATFRGRLTLFLDAGGLPEDRTLLRALAAYELTRLCHLARTLGVDNRSPVTGDPAGEAPLGLHLLGHGLAGEAAAELVPGLSRVDYLWFGDPRGTEAWLAWCRSAEAALARALREDVGLPAGQVPRRWLDSTAAQPGVPPLAGRYLAARAVEDCRARRGFGELAALEAGEAVAEVAWALERLAFAAADPSLAPSTAEETPGPAAGGFPSHLVRFVNLFNAGAYFESHEVLEEAWRATGSDLYQGLILVSAALVKRERGNARGLRRNLEKALGYLDRCPPAHLGVDVEELRGRVRGWLRALARADPEAGGLPELVPPPSLRLDPRLLRGDEPELRA